MVDHAPAPTRTPAPAAVEAGAAAGGVIGPATRRWTRGPGAPAAQPPRPSPPASHGSGPHRLSCLLGPADVLAMQRSVGNHAVQALLLRSSTIPHGGPTQRLGAARPASGAHNLGAPRLAPSAAATTPAAPIVQRFIKYDLKKLAKPLSLAGRLTGSTYARIVKTFKAYRKEKTHEGRIKRVGDLWSLIDLWHQHNTPGPTSKLTRSQRRKQQILGELRVLVIQEANTLMKTLAVGLVPADPADTSSEASSESSEQTGGSAPASSAPGAAPVPPAPMAAPTGG